ncbi:MAG: hypothetical protein ACHQHO_02680 [Solirubrobacterales bacterium]
MQGEFRYWAFGATVDRVRDSDDVLQIQAVSLQPVGILISERVVVTCRHPGIRYPLGDIAMKPEVGLALSHERLVTSAQDSLVSLLRGAPPFESHALLFGILAGLISTLFEARAALGAAKILSDDAYFSRLIHLRREAATADVRSEQVARAAREATHLIDQTRNSLSAIQRVAVPFRQWFDYMKPPGLPDTAAVWLSHTPHTAASEHVVDRIYKVRNDLQAVRREVHQSMNLLASADTGSQLLAVRALLDRTESVRNAVVIAGAMTILLAAAGLSAAVATIPSSGTEVSPLPRAIAYTAVTVMTIVVVGVAVAIASRLKAPRSRRLWLGLSVGCFVLALTGLLFAAAANGSARIVLVACSVGVAVVSLLIAAFTGDFGPQRQRAVLTPVIRLLVKDSSSWSGSPQAFAAALLTVLQSSSRQRLAHPLRARALAGIVSEWDDDLSALELTLLDERLNLRRAGLEASYADHTGVIVRRVAGDDAGG